MEHCYLITWLLPSLTIDCSPYYCWLLSFIIPTKFMANCLTHSQILSIIHQWFTIDHCYLIMCNHIFFDRDSPLIMVIDYSFFSPLIIVNHPVFPSEPRCSWLSKAICTCPTALPAANDAGVDAGVTDGDNGNECNTTCRESSGLESMVYSWLVNG